MSKVRESARHWIGSELALTSGLDINERTRETLEIVQTLLIGLQGSGLSEKEVIQWLSAPDPESTALQHRKKQDEETCEWILEEPKFISWASNDSYEKNLWIVGLPGT